MDKPLLINEFELTEKIFMQYARVTYYIFRKKFRLWAFLLFLLSGVCVGLLIWLWDQPLWGILPSVLSLYFLYMFFFGYQYSGTSSFRNLKEFYGYPIKMKVLFHKNHFKVETDKGSNEFLYTQVSHCIIKKDLSILIVGAQGIIQHGQVIDLRVFSPTEKEQFLELMEKLKCKTH